MERLICTKFWEFVERWIYTIIHIATGRTVQGFGMPMQEKSGAYKLDMLHHTATGRTFPAFWEFVERLIYTIFWEFVERLIYTMIHIATPHSNWMHIPSILRVRGETDIYTIIHIATGGTV